MNHGIMHIAHRRGGRPLCGSRSAHMSTTLEALGDWPRVCKKCAANVATMRAAKADRCDEPPRNLADADPYAEFRMDAADNAAA